MHLLKVILVPIMLEVMLLCIIGVTTFMNLFRSMVSEEWAPLGRKFSIQTVHCRSSFFLKHVVTLIAVTKFDISLRRPPIEPLVN